MSKGAIGPIKDSDVALDPVRENAATGQLVARRWRIPWTRHRRGRAYLASVPCGLNASGLLIQLLPVQNSTELNTM